MKRIFKHILAFAVLAVFITFALGSASSSPAPKGGTRTKGPHETVELRLGVDVSDESINNIFNNLSTHLKEGLSIALIPIYPSPGVDKDTADFITERLDIQFTYSNKYNMFSRENINLAIGEQNFQMENVSNDSAVAFGKLVGADAVIIGAVDGKAANQRIVMRALEVNTGRILTMFMEQTSSQEGFSEIVIKDDRLGSMTWLMGNYLQTNRVTLKGGEEVTFKVPNGYWEVWVTTGGFADFTIEELNDTRLFLRIVHRSYHRTPYIVEEVRRENIGAAAGSAANRAGHAQAAAQKLAGELTGKVSARAGTAFFPLTVNGITADDGNFLFDVMSIELANNGGFNIIEKQKLLALLNEYDFQMSGMVGVRTIGQLLGADVVIFGIGKQNEIELAAVDVARFSLLAQISHKF